MTRRTSFLLTASLKVRYRQCVLAGRGYGKQRRSQWLSEAITDLVVQDPGLRNAGLGSRVTRFDATDDLVLTAKAEAALLRATALLRRQDPFW